MVIYLTYDQTYASVRETLEKQWYLLSGIPRCKSHPFFSEEHARGSETCWLEVNWVNQHSIKMWQEAGKSPWVIFLVEIVQFWNEVMILDCVWRTFSAYQSTVHNFRGVVEYSCEIKDVPWNLDSRTLVKLSLRVDPVLTWLICSMT